MARDAFSSVTQAGQKGWKFGRSGSSTTALAKDMKIYTGRGADPRFGVIGDLHSLGRKTPLRMRVSDPQATREVTNRRIKINFLQNQASTLD